ncbi:NADPH-dependent FMN reductase [Duganella sp. CF517]|uniref:flavodoxin family protein n=1 Tax=Duganella sp. CF517 TaxID=1881038 RepID=UPI0008C9C0A8|nr:NAD(P)H-dependent oxidoreductase [Duganella sp. CF517]SEN76874.1 NADPH-dependent FMN reductase [Duganella sp. CF517]
MKLCLIVYYSRTGTTAKLADALAQACGADVERLQDLHPRDGALGFMRSAWQGWRKAPGDIAPPQRRPSDYPFIVLGTPVWAGNMSAPMRRYILRQREHFRRVGLFCTAAGGDGRDALTSMAAMCNKLPVASMSLRQGDVLAGRYQQALADFTSELAIVQRDEARTAPSAPLASPV